MELLSGYTVYLLKLDNTFRLNQNPLDTTLCMDANLVKTIIVESTYIILCMDYTTSFV